MPAVGEPIHHDLGRHRTQIERCCDVYDDPCSVATKSQPVGKLEECCVEAPRQVPPVRLTMGPSEEQVRPIFLVGCVPTVCVGQCFDAGAPRNAERILPPPLASLRIFLPTMLGSDLPVLELEEMRDVPSAEVDVALRPYDLRAFATKTNYSRIPARESGYINCCCCGCNLCQRS